MASNTKNKNMRKPPIRMVKFDDKHLATKEQKLQRIGTLGKVRRGFLRLVQTVTTITAVIVTVYMSATVLLPTIGGVLSEAVGLSGQVHFYNMLQSWGFPMLCITGIIIFGNIYICKYMVKLFRDFFQSKIDESFMEVNKKI